MRHYFFPDIIFNIHIIELLLHKIHELHEVDGSAPVDVNLHNDGVELDLAGVLTHGPQHVEELHRGDCAAPILRIVMTINMSGIQTPQVQTLSNSSKASLNSASSSSPKAVMICLSSVRLLETAAEKCHE